MLKNTVRRLFQKAGIEIVPLRRAPRLAQALRLRKLFNHFDIQCVLDVGANEGQFRDFLRAEVGFSGEIHSFEPIPSLGEKLIQLQSNDPNWFIHRFALGKETGEREFNVMRTTVYSSFLEPTHDVVRDRISENAVAQKERVHVETLDRIAAGSSLQTVNLAKVFVKLDTQGFDLEVLNGGRCTIAKVPLLQTEVSIRPLYKGMPDIYDSISAFAECGFAISDFFLVAEDRNRRAIEFDCVMVRERN